MLSERIIIGIDPGTLVMGYGVIKASLQKIEVLQYGVVDLHKLSSHALKLQKIFKYTLELLEEFTPDEVALEAPFCGKNVQSMLKLGRAQGVAMAAALMREIPVTEYAPRKVKQSVTGNGNATKEQVAYMLMNLLKFESIPQKLDASDALAVAVCHVYQKQNPNPRPNNWKQFLKENPSFLA